MPVPVYTAADYAVAMQALLPRGRLWPRDTTAVQSKVVAGLANSYSVQHARAAQLLADAFPTSTLEFLPEWESTLGLPSAAAGPNPSQAARALLVAARFIGLAGADVASIQAFAALL